MEPSIVAVAAPLTITLALIGLALAVIFVLFRAARGQRIAIRQLNQLEGRTQHVDLESFRNLVNADDEEFLRARLSPGVFRRVQRQRMLAAAEYVRRAAHNAAILLSLGEAVRQQAEPEVAEAGQQLVNSAIQLRKNALLALAMLYARAVFPMPRLSLGQVIEIYEKVTDRTLHLTRLQDPAYAARVSAVI